MENPIKITIMITITIGRWAGMELPDFFILTSVF